MRTDAGKPMKLSANAIAHLGDKFADYIDWRAENPSDDIMTELLNMEFAGRNRSSPPTAPRRVAEICESGGRCR